MKTNEKIKNFDGSSVNNIIAKFDTKAKFLNRTREAIICITNNNTSCTIGTDLISLLEININGKTLQISTASTTSFSEDIVAQFPNLTAPAQGTFQVFKHVITLSNNIKPHVAKPRTILFARREAASTECQRMIDEGI